MKAKPDPGDTSSLKVLRRFLVACRGYSGSLAKCDVRGECAWMHHRDVTDNGKHRRGCRVVTGMQALQYQSPKAFG